MNRTLLNYWIDAALFVLMGAMAFIGVLLGFFIGKGPGVPAEQKQFWGIGRHDWGDIHLWFAIAFVPLLIVHLVLHWSWIVRATKMAFRPGACQEDKGRPSVG